MLTSQKKQNLRESFWIFCARK